MLTLANVVHLFSHKFSGLCAGRLTFTRIFLSTFDGLLFRHKHLLPKE